MNRSFRVVVAVLALAVLVGCATQQPTSPTAGLTEPIHPPTPPDLGRDPGTVEIEDVGPYNFYITEEVRLICSGPDPLFAFDVSKPMGNDQPTMQNLVFCMKQGALAGKTIKLIGHTDPRGTPGYNEHLGLERAEKVKKFLVANGVAPERVQTGSIGAEEAAPGPKEWAKDRRVHIELVH